MRASHLNASTYLVMLLLAVAQKTLAGRIFFEKCDYKGFLCTKSTKFTGKYDVAFGCNAVTGWDIDFYLWQFRATPPIISLKIANCTNVRLNLMCSTETHRIQTFHIKNITKLTIVPPVHTLLQSASEMTFEDIEELDTIPKHTFIQVKQYPYSKFSCSTPPKEVESVIFQNVRINEIERDAFYNLLDMQNFTFNNVTVRRMHAFAVQVFLRKTGEMRMIGSKVDVIEYMALYVRGPKLTMVSNLIEEIHSGAINATIFDMDYLNNTVKSVHTAAFRILAQNVRILDSSFHYLANGAFQAIGPGLPENSFQGFGHLKFLYEFRNNLIESLEVASLQPDWRAYKNVGSVINVSYNAIKCTCAELAWLGSVDGFGRDFSTLHDFHEIILKMENKNICVDAPCILPIDAVKLMTWKDGRCLLNVTQEDMCDIYYPPSTTTTTRKPTTTKRSTVKFIPNATPPSFYQKRLALKSKASCLEFNFITVIFYILTFCTYNI